MTMSKNPGAQKVKKSPPDVLPPPRLPTTTTTSSSQPKIQSLKSSSSKLKENERRDVNDIKENQIKLKAYA